MRVAVIYGSRLGSTRGIAERIATRLGASGLEVELAAAEQVGDLPAAEAYVIGSGVYMGSWLRPGIEYLERNQLQLAARPIGHRRADHQIALPAQPAQQRRPARQQRHEQRHPFLPAQRP